MKTRFFAGLIAAILPLFIACGGSSTSGETNTDETSTTSEEVKGNETNKTRPEAPNYLKITRYKTSPDDTEGTILSLEEYDANGYKVKFVAYDYYGSGEVESSTSYENDDNGNTVIMDDGNTRNTYEYENGVKIKESWSRANGQGASKEYSYDENGNEVEEKNFNADGTYDFSRVTEYEYDANGNILREVKWEKYTDGSADLHMYERKYEYNDKGVKVKEFNLREDGAEIGYTVFKYDPAGNLIEEWEYEDGAVDSRTVNEVNEYGEVVKDYLYNSDSDESLQFTNEYSYDQYGNMIDMMYRHTDGDAWGERTVIEYQE